jgi:hypothetical protein
MWAVEALTLAPGEVKPSFNPWRSRRNFLVLNTFLRNKPERLDMV